MREMKKLRFSYEMKLKFDTPVQKHRFTIRCVPQSNDRQEIRDLQVAVYPREFLSEDQDSFGNLCIYGYSEHAHDHFSIAVSGTAKTGLADRESEEQEYRAGAYKYPTRYTKPGDELTAYYKKLSLKRSGDSFQDALEIMERLYQDFRYTPGVTKIQTTAEDAIRLGCGVCQDYSHIMIALCQMSGIPARYVVGMLMGEGLSHAWVEIYDGGAWRGIDPTNHTIVGDQHIKISSGRDYDDCTINEGIFVGNARQSQEASVIVEEIEDD